MLEISISNSQCCLKDVPPEVETLLSESLRYLNQNTSYAYHKNLRRINYLSGQVRSNPHLAGELGRLKHINRSLYHKLYKQLYVNQSFPTGLLPRVQLLLEERHIVYTLNDTRKKPAINQIKYVLKEPFPALRYYQKAAARVAFEKGRGVIVSPCGTGKTTLVCKMIWDLGLKTLVITPNKSLTDNMFDTLVEHFGKSKVERLNTKSIPKKDISVCNIQALIKIKPELIHSYPVVFIDEFHHTSADTYLEVNQNHLKNTYYKIGVTATNFRNDGSDMGLESVLSDTIYEYTIRQAIQDGFIVPPEFELIPIDIVPQESYQQEYKLGIVENEERNQVIADIAQHHLEDSVLILVQQIPHGDRIKKLIPKCEFITGEEKDSQRQKLMKSFRSGDLKCLIGTSVIGEGVDLPIANILILAGGGKARSQVIQNVGRALRPYPGKTKAVIYDFSDSGSNWLSEHSELRQELRTIYNTE